MISRLLLIISICFAVNAGAAGTRGGDFIEASAMPSFLKIRDDLVRRIQSLPDEVLYASGAPMGWGKFPISKVIAQVKINSEKFVQEQDGRFKKMDYDLEENSIEVLGGFFIYYGLALEDLALSPANAQKIEIKLLKEVSHLWGFGDEAGELFGINIADAILMDYLFCNFTDSKKEKHYVIYSFGDEVARFRTGWLEDRLSLIWPLRFQKAALAPEVMSLRSVRSGYKLSEANLEIKTPEFELVVRRRPHESMTEGYLKTKNPSLPKVNRRVKCTMPLYR
jgi:hypothetical protein